MVEHLTFRGFRGDPPEFGLQGEMPERIGGSHQACVQLQGKAWSVTGCRGGTYVLRASAERADMLAPAATGGARDNRSLDCVPNTATSRGPLSLVARAILAIIRKCRVRGVGPGEHGGRDTAGERWRWTGRGV